MQNAKAPSTRWNASEHWNNVPSGIAPARKAGVTMKIGTTVETCP